MEFPVDALIRVHPDKLNSGRVFQWSGNWYYRLRSEPHDLADLCRTIILTGPTAGRIEMVDASERVLAVASDWSCAVRINQLSDLTFERAVAGRIAVGPKGPYLLAKDMHGKPLAFRWGDAADHWTDLVEGPMGVMTAQRWRCVLTREGRDDGPELFTVDLQAPKA